MECTRCRGLLVEDHLYDSLGTQGFMSTRCWRCINCGHTTDPTAMANRRLHDATALLQPSEEPEPEHVYLRGNASRQAAA